MEDLATAVSEFTVSIDTIWILIAAVLVMFMQPGFALVEAGFTRSKNTANILMKNMMDFSIGSLIFWLLGYTIMYGEDIGGFIGKVSLFFNSDEVNGVPDKTSLMFSLKDSAGALYKALKPFAENGINLTKIESRPCKGKPWEYIFFVDLEGHHSEPGLASALELFREGCSDLKILGSYPHGRQARAEDVSRIEKNGSA